jgi:hypothetical protein
MSGNKMETKTMTAGAADKLGAGAAINALVAELLLGYQSVRKFWPWPQSGLVLFDEGQMVRPGVGAEPMLHDIQMIPDYSSSMEAAWIVVNRLRDLGWSVDVRSGRHAITKERWLVEADKHEMVGVCHGVGQVREGDECKAWGMTAPLAICRVALKAVALEGK